MIIVVLMVVSMAMKTLMIMIMAIVIVIKVRSRMGKIINKSSMYIMEQAASMTHHISISEFHHHDDANEKKNRQRVFSVCI